MIAARFAALLALCRRDPDRLALVAEREAMTFGRLAARAAGIRAALAETPDGAVLIHGHKELDVVAGMIGAALAGRAFVFADTGYPAARVAQTIEACGCGVVLRTDPAAPDTGRPTLDACALPDAEPTGLALDPAEEDRPFYVTFTSGSTGTPKGILVTRASFAALQDWFEPQNTGSAGGGYAHVSHASMAFDMSMSDIWTALFAGRAVILLSHANNLNPRANLAHMIRMGEACPPATLTATPAFFSLMLEDERFRADRLPHLRAFWIGGEAVQIPLLRRLRAAFPGAEIHHAYGPSEATCITHSVLLTEADLDGGQPLTLGPNRSGCAALVDRGDGRLVPSGEGEIVLRGPQVSSGYLPASHPGNARFGLDRGERTYRTGDQGRVERSGGLTIRGRIDGQVKVNGFRIELGAIERCALAVPGVSAAVALPASKQGDGRGLVLVLAGGGAAEAEAARAAIRAELPAYMVPARVLTWPSLPLSNSGKIDRRAVEARIGAA